MALGQEMWEGRPMRFLRVGVFLAGSASAWVATGGSAPAAGPCDVIVQRSNQITQQLAFT
jgi:hypothetical protein